MVFTKLSLQCLLSKVMSALQCGTTGKKPTESPENEKKKSGAPALVALCLLLCEAGLGFVCQTLLPACGLEKGTEILQYGDDARISMESDNSHLKTRASLLCKALSEDYRQDSLVCQISGWDSFFLGWESGQICFSL